MCYSVCSWDWKENYIFFGIWGYFDASHPSINRSIERTNDNTDNWCVDTLFGMYTEEWISILREIKTSYYISGLTGFHPCCCCCRFLYCTCFILSVIAIYKWYSLIYLTHIFSDQIDYFSHRLCQETATVVFILAQLNKIEKGFQQAEQLPFYSLFN